MNLNNINLEGVQNEYSFNAKSIFEDDDNDNIYSGLQHSCAYYETEQFQDKVKDLSNQISIFSMNIRSLPNKIHEFKDYLSELNHGQFKFNVIGLQEVWTVPLNTNLSLPGYSKIEAKVRDNSKITNRSGGGVAFFVDEDMEYEILEKHSIFIPHVFESIFIKLKISKNRYMTIGNIYRPNSAPLASIVRFNDILSELIDNLKKDFTLQSDEITLIGDININLLQYLNHSETSNYVDILLNNELLPLIVLPSRVTHQSATVIDHIVTNIKDNVLDSGILLNNMSDHFPVFFIRHFKTEKKRAKITKTRKITENTKTNFKNLIKDFTWDSVINEHDPQQAFSKFFDIFNGAFNLSFPETENKPNKNKLILG
jgi:hypothetical protein